MPFELRDYFETSDGSRPETRGLAEDVAKRLPLAAFSILRGGDVFERVSAKADKVSERAAQNAVRTYFAKQVEIVCYDASHEVNTLYKVDVTVKTAELLGYNTALLERLMVAKPLRIDVAQPGESFVKLGLPRAMRPSVEGVFWDAPEWPQARIVFRAEKLAARGLVAHEMAHAVFYLALTDSERKLVYDVLKATFGSRNAMDEAFAIYSERETIPSYQRQDLEVSGIYGAVRRQWSDDHVFTRFIRKLYYPAKRLAGPQMTPPTLH